MATSTLQQQIDEAVQPVSQFWPMKGFVSHNPLQGLEHLPFDEAFRQARQLFGAEGYLPLEEYRALYRAGRIDAASIDRALARIRPGSEQSVAVASRSITEAEVQRAHLLHGVDALEPALFDWQVMSQAALTRPRAGAAARDDVGALWQAALAALGLVDPRFAGPDEPADEAGSAGMAELPFRRTLSDWIDEVTDSSIVATIDSQVIKWVSSFVDEGMAGWEMPSKPTGFYAAWRELAQLVDVAAQRLASRHNELLRANRLLRKKLKELQTALKTALGRDVEIRTEVRDEIIGGLIVKVGSRMFDSSLRTKLEGVRRAMKEA